MPSQIVPFDSTPPLRWLRFDSPRAIPFIPVGTRLPSLAYGPAASPRLPRIKSTSDLNRRFERPDFDTARDRHSLTDANMNPHQKNKVDVKVSIPPPPPPSSTFLPWCIPGNPHPHDRPHSCHAHDVRSHQMDTSADLFSLLRADCVRWLEGGGALCFSEAGCTMHRPDNRKLTKARL